MRSQRGEGGFGVARGKDFEEREMACFSWCQTRGDGFGRRQRLPCLREFPARQQQLGFTRVGQGEVGIGGDGAVEAFHRAGMRAQQQTHCPTMNGAQHILVVDDEPDLRKLVSDFLTRNGYHVFEAHDGVAMMETLKSSRVDLVILDISMPGEDGLSLCRRLRVAGATPIIMLTAMGTEIDRIVGLEMGADDYLPKPFNTAELLARIRAVLRRFQSSARASAPGADRVYAFAGWRLDVVRRRLHAPTGALVDLRAAEFALLVAFVEQPLHVFTRSQLLDLAQGAGTAAGRNIDVHVSRLRRRIEADPEQPDFIKTVRGEGYLFAAPVTLNGRPG